MTKKNPTNTFGSNKMYHRHSQNFSPSWSGCSLFTVATGTILKSVISSWVMGSRPPSVTLFNTWIWTGDGEDGEVKSSPKWSCCHKGHVGHNQNCIIPHHLVDSGWKITLGLHHLIWGGGDDALLKGTLAVWNCKMEGISPENPEEAFFSISHV